MILQIEITETEYKAMEYVALSVQEWTDNMFTNRARIAIDEIVSICVEKCLENGVAIPSTKEEIVQLAFDNGYVKTVAEKNAEIEAQIIQE